MFVSFTYHSIPFLQTKPNDINGKQSVAGIPNDIKPKTLDFVMVVVVANIKQTSRLLYVERVNLSACHMVMRMYGVVADTSFFLGDHT